MENITNSTYGPWRENCEKDWWSLVITSSVLFGFKTTAAFCLKRVNFLKSTKDPSLYYLAIVNFWRNWNNKRSTLRVSLHLTCFDSTLSSYNMIFFFRSRCFIYLELQYFSISHLLMFYKSTFDLVKKSTLI